MLNNKKRQYNALSNEENFTSKTQCKRVDDMTTTIAFRTEPRSKFDIAFPFFRKPEEYGYFSQDSSRTFCNDKSQKRYYIEPRDPQRVQFDLTDGYSRMIRKDETSPEYLHDMLRWVMQNSVKFQLQSEIPEGESDQSPKIKSLNTDFICWRGLLTRLLCTPYENRDGWIIAVTRFKGTYFLCEFETEGKKQQREEMTPNSRSDQMCSWGWKFEQYLTSNEPTGTPDTSVPVNNNEGFCSVVRTRLSTHSLVFGGEVDCVDSNNKYVELKTTREMETRRQRENFYRYKLIKWWAQSFLIGIERIIAGLRDDHGTVHFLEEFKTQDIPNMGKNFRDPWSAAVCFNFLNEFLNFLKETVTTDDPSVVYVCRWSPRQDVTCEKMTPGSEFVFLPDWFIKWEAWA